MDDKSLAIAFGESLKEDSIACISDLAEVGLDAIMDDGILKDIPILSTAVAVYKIVSSIKERHNMKKLVMFLNQINHEIPDEQQRFEYQQKFQSNKPFRNQELEYLLVLIERYIGYDKPKMLAKLYAAYLDGFIIWEELTMYAEVIDRFLPLDCNTLISESNKITVHRNIGGESLLRLVALGLMTETNENSIFEQTANGFGISTASMECFASNDKTYKRTEFGNKLAKILK